MNNMVRSYVCDGMHRSIRPTWKLMGFFNPSDAGCIALSASKYEVTVCDVVVTDVPTVTPQPSITTQPTDSPSSSPLPSVTPQPSDGPENLVQNPGFDDGTTTSWGRFGGVTISAVTSPAPQSGSHSARITGRWQPWHGISQEMAGKLVVGQSYTVSAYVQLPSAPYNVEMTFREGSSTYIHAASTTVTTANQWVQLIGAYTASADSSILMYIQGPPGGVDIYVDSVSVLELDTRSPTVSPVSVFKII